MQQPYSEENAHERHHHAVSRCGEEISKASWAQQSLLYNSEKLTDLIIERPDDIHRNLPDWVFLAHTTFQLDIIKVVQMAC